MKKPKDLNALAIKIKRLTSTAKLPTYAHMGDAGMDVYSNGDFILKPGERAKIPLGFAAEIPVGYVGLVWMKSGLADTYGVSIMGGVIDSSYRGEWHAQIINNSKAYNVHLTTGAKVAQVVIVPFICATIEEVQELSETTRGKNGFGSTGK